MVAYDPEKTSCVWIIEDGNYVQFALIDKQYDNRSFAVAYNDMVRSDNYIKRFAKDSVQARISLIKDIQTITEQCTAREDIDLTAVRKTRSKEKIKRRLEV